MSLLTPATVERMNAMRFPSGEYIGARSSDPGGGDVISRMLESPSDSTAIQARVGSLSLLSENAIRLPSGDHESPPPICDGPRYNRRSVPPSAGTVKIENTLSEYLVNAISCPSGDQVGQQSPESLVS